MVLLFLSCLWMLLVPLSFGSWLLGQLRRWSEPYVSSDEAVSLIVIWWLGMALLTATLETWALFGPLRGPVFLVIGALALGLPLTDRASWQQVVQCIRVRIINWRPLAWLTTAFIGANLLALAALPPLDGDTGIYHAPFIRWLEEAGTVPGLANLDLHLGYNSSWFAVEVLSSWGQWLGSPLQSLMPLALLLFTCYALVPLNNTPSKHLDYTSLFRPLLGITLLFWGSYGILSLGADSASVTLSFTILSQALELGIPSRNRPLTVGHLAILLLVLYAITVKFTVVPLALIPLFWLWRYHSTTRIKPSLLIRLACFGLVLGLPWLLNTAVLTGYLLFPFPALDILTVEWKVPKEAVYEHVSYIRNFARNPALSQYNVYGKPITYWLPIWWQQQQVYDRLLTLLLPVVALLSFGLLFYSRAWQRSNLASWKLALCTTLGGTIFWFGSAPAYRFGYPFILPLFCLLLLPLLEAGSRKLSMSLRPVLILGMIGSLLGNTVLIELSAFGVPRQLTAAKFNHLLTQLSSADTRTMVEECYQADSTGRSLRAYLPGATKLRLVYVLVIHGQLQENGLVSTGQRWLHPAQYPINTFEEFQVKQIKFLRPVAHPAHAEYGYWYAPFPATSNTAIRLRANQLQSGFLPY